MVIESQSFTIDLSPELRASLNVLRTPECALLLANIRHNSHLFERVFVFPTPRPCHTCNGKDCLIMKRLKSSGLSQK